MAKILLIIEDDKLVLEMYRVAFELAGLEVKVAHDGMDGIIIAEEAQPNLILCDVMMPRMNGLEVLDKLKLNDKTKDIPVIMLTNLAGSHDAEVAKEKGAKAYLVKNKYKPHEIVELIKTLI